MTERRTHGDWDGGFEPEIRCPFCGKTDDEHCDYPEKLQHDGDESEYECAYCEEKFLVTLCVAYDYATKPRGEP